MTAQPYRFDYNPMQIGQYIQKGVEQGFQQGQERKLADLASQAYADPMNASGAIQQAIATDPDYGQKLAHWNDTQKQDFMQKAAGAAQYLLSAKQTGNAQAVQGAYQSVKPWLQKLGDIHGGNVPDQWDDSMLPALHQIVANSGGSMGVGQDGIVVGGRLVDRRTGKEMYSPPSYQLKEDRDGNLYRVPVNPGAQPEMVFGQGGQVAQPPVPDNTFVPDANGHPTSFNADFPQNLRRGILNNPESDYIDLGRTAQTPKFGKPENVPSGYRMGANGTLEPIPGGPADNQDMGGKLGDAAIDNAATRYNITGTLPPLGMGKDAAALRSRILERAAEIAKAQGLSATDLATQPGDYKNDQASLKGLQQSSAAMARATDALHSNAQLLLEQSKKVFGHSFTGTQPENSLRLSYGRVTNDPDVRAYDNYVQTVINEYAKIIGGAPGSNAAATEGASQRAAEAIHKASSPEALKATIEALYKEAENFRNANDAQISRIKSSRIVGGSQPAGSEATTNGDRTSQVLKLLNEARDAIRQGADKEAVKQRLIQQGLTNIAGRI